MNIGLGDVVGELRFASDLDAMNHVLSESEVDAGTGNAIKVPVSRLDTDIGDVVPVMIKIDVEGFELPVLKGAHQTLSMPELLVVILETNGFGVRYGYSDAMVHALMQEYGFRSVRYDPFARQLELMAPDEWNEGNTVYVRDLEAMRERIALAPEFLLGTGVRI